MEKILEIKNLSKSFYNLTGEIQVLNNINIDIYEGEFLSILGTSGCGKSSLLNILSSLDKEYIGTINLNNKKIGYMLQQDSLFEWLTILDNALLGLKIQNNLTKENIEYTKNLLIKYGLKDFLFKHPSSLSGGMKQRVVCI